MENKEQLQSFIDIIERLEADETELRQDKSEVYAEAKSSGYDVKAMKKIVAMLKRDRDELAEEDALVEAYKSALNI